MAYTVKCRMKKALESNLDINISIKDFGLVFELGGVSRPQHNYQKHEVAS